MASDTAWTLGIDVRHLRYFREVADKGSFSEAARELHCAQPPLSRQIRQLEERLGLILFERRPRGVTLTKAGKIFRSEVDAVLRRLDTAVHAVQRFDASDSIVSINVGYAPSPTAGFLDHVVKTLEGKFPQIRLVLHDLSVGQTVRQLAQHGIDFALTVEPFRPRVQNLIFEPLIVSEMRCAVSAVHPLAARKFVSLTQLRRERLLIFSPSEMPQYSHYLRDAFRRHRMRLRPAQEYDGIATLLPAVERGHGVALLLESAAAAAGPDIKWLRIRPVLPRVRVGILYRAPADKLLRKIIRATQIAVRSMKRTPALRQRSYGLGSVAT